MRPIGWDAGGWSRRAVQPRPIADRLPARLRPLEDVGAGGAWPSHIRSLAGTARPNSLTQHGAMQDDVHRGEADVPMGGGAVRTDDGSKVAEGAAEVPGDGYYPPSLMDTDHFLHSDLGRLAILLWAAPLGALIAVLQEGGLSPLTRWAVSGAIAAFAVLAIVYITRCVLRATPLRGRVPAGMVPYRSAVGPRGRHSKGRHRAH